MRRADSRAVRQILTLVRPRHAPECARTVIAATAALWGAIAVAGPRVSAPIAIDAPVYSGADGFQEYPVLAASTAGVLAVWQDLRDGARSIWAARVVAGAPLDPTGFAIATGPGGRTGPAVASDGTGWLVVWEETSGAGDVLAVRVSAAGVVLDAAPIPVAANPSVPSKSPRVAFDGVNYVVAWSEARGASLDIFLARVTPAGTVLDPAGVAVCTQTADQSSPRLGCDGATACLVVWEDLRAGDVDVYAARVTRAGAVLDPDGFSLGAGAGNQAQPALAFDGQRYAVVWADGSSGAFRVVGKRVSPAGAVLDAQPVAVSSTAGGFTPSIAFDGQQFLVAWTTPPGGNYDVAFARAELTLAPLDAPPLSLVALPDFEGYPSVVFDGANFLAAWSDDRTSSQDSDVYLGRVSPQGATLDGNGRLLSAAANNQRGGAVATDGRGYLVVWEDDRDRPVTIYARALGPDGLAETSGAVSVGLSTVDRTLPDVAFGGGVYLVTWLELPPSNALRVARFSQAGALLDPGGLLIASGNVVRSRPRVAFDGANFLIAWEDRRTGGPDVWAARVSPGGMVLDPAGVPVTALGNLEWDPAVAPAPGGFLVTWADYNGGLHVAGARVSSAGAVLDPGGFRVSLGLGNGGMSMAAFDGRQHRAAWSTSGQLAAARVLAPDGGEVPTALSATPAIDLAPAVAWDGAQTWLAWKDTLGDAGAVGALWSEDGGFELFSLAADRSVGGVALGFTSAARGAALTSHFDATGGFGSRRLELRLLGVLANGEVCVAPDDCGSSVCVLGVCCPSSCTAAVCAGGVCGAMVVDGGVADGGVADGGAPDPDGGRPDAGTPADSSRGRYRVGCGCDGSGWPPLLAALVAVFGSSRRRSNRR